MVGLNTKQWKKEGGHDSLVHWIGGLATVKAARIKTSHVSSSLPPSLRNVSFVRLHMSIWTFISSICSLHDCFPYMSFHPLPLIVVFK